MIGESARNFYLSHVYTKHNTDIQFFLDPIRTDPGSVNEMSPEMQAYNTLLVDP